MEVTKLKEYSSNTNNPNGNGSDQKRTIPAGLRQFLNWDKTLTDDVVTFMQRKFPNVTKSESKFMEVYIVYLSSIPRSNTEIFLYYNNQIYHNILHNFYLIDIIHAFRCLEVDLFGYQAVWYFFSFIRWCLNN